MLALLWMLVFVLSAQARDCVSGEAPAGYVIGTCGGSAALPDLCTSTSSSMSTSVDCRADGNDGTGSSEVYLETLDSNDGYVVYGTDANALAFCCAFDEEELFIGSINIRLTPQDDTIDATLFRNVGPTNSQYVTIKGLAGDDTMVGPTDSNTYSFKAEGGGGSDALYSYDELSLHYGGAGNDTLYGDSDGNILHGDDADLETTGNDTIYAGGGNDQVFPGNGDDLAYGGAGADIIHAYEGDDEVYGEGGDDWLTGGAGPDLLVGGDGNDLIQGEGGIDVLHGNAGADDLYGGSEADTLCSGTTPTGEEDALYGGSGNDVMWAPTGPSNPSGSDTSGSNTCGHTIHGAFLTSGSCSYTLTVAPTECS